MGTQRSEGVAAEQDRGSFGEAYAEHFRGVYGAAHRVLRDPAVAEEVAQEVFLALWLKPDRFDPARGPLGSYLRLTARSRALDRWREAQAAARTEERLKLAADLRDGRRDEQPAEQAERTEQAAIVTGALRRLPDAQREALLLAYGGERTSKEIAQLSEVPVGTAKSRIRLGLLRLREECEGLLAA